MPENTLPAFQLGMELGVDYVEFDLVVSGENELIVSHDPVFLSAICLDPNGKPIPKKEESKHNLYRMTYAEISAYDCGSVHQRKFPIQQQFPVAKPRLDDVVALVESYRSLTGKNIRYNIEIKSKEGEEGITQPDVKTFAQKVYDYAMAHRLLDHAMFQSFDFRAVKALHDIDPSLHLGVLTSIPEGSARKNIEKLGFIPERYNPHYLTLSKSEVKWLHSKGIKVTPWTVNKKKSMERMKRWGVDGVITDYPDLAVQIFR